jgi:2-iminobutanoate/2-iminopropanoate deaminase
LTLDNLTKTVKAAGGTLADITQILIYITDAKHFAAVNEIYKEYFAEPYPNRATVIAGLLVPGMHIEIVAHAHFGQ